MLLYTERAEISLLAIRQEVGSTKRCVKKRYGARLAVAVHAASTALTTSAYDRRKIAAASETG